MIQIYEAQRSIDLNLNHSHLTKKFAASFVHQYLLYNNLCKQQNLLFSFREIQPSLLAVFLTCCPPLLFLDKTLKSGLINQPSFEINVQVVSVCDVCMCVHDKETKLMKNGIKPVDTVGTIRLQMLVPGNISIYPDWIIWTSKRMCPSYRPCLSEL